MICYFLIQIVPLNLSARLPLVTVNMQCESGLMEVQHGSHKGYPIEVVTSKPQISERSFGDRVGSRRNP